MVDGYVVVQLIPQYGYFGNNLVKDGFTWQSNKNTIYIRIELLSPKQNGTVDPDRESQKAQKASIKGMWRKAFRSLKQSKSDKPDTKYSKLSTRRSFLKRKDSKEAQQEEQVVDVNEEIDPVYSLLKCAADLPKGKHHCHTTCHSSPKAAHRTSVGQTNLAASATSDSLNVKSTGSSRSSSPSSADAVTPTNNCGHPNCRCPCSNCNPGANIQTPTMNFSERPFEIYQRSKKK